MVRWMDPGRLLEEAVRASPFPLPATQHTHAQALLPQSKAKEEAGGSAAGGRCG